MPGDGGAKAPSERNNETPYTLYGTYPPSETTPESGRQVVGQSPAALSIYCFYAQLYGCTL